MAVGFLVACEHRRISVCVTSDKSIFLTHVFLGFYATASVWLLRHSPLVLVGSS